MSFFQLLASAQEMPESNHLPFFAGPQGPKNICWRAKDPRPEFGKIDIECSQIRDTPNARLGENETR
jgi:hypothetical protein